MTAPVVETGDDQRGFGLSKGGTDAPHHLFPDLGLVTEANQRGAGL
jgi:hypothetical protein